MKRSWILVLIAANLLALGALALIFPDLMVSPGPVVKAHAAIATDCFSCHAPFRGASADLCVGCHAVKDIGLRTSLGQPIVLKRDKVAFHQQLQEKSCIACHTDHTSPGLTRQNRKIFSHALLPLATQQRCDSCHKPPADTMHQQISGNCAQCHTSTQWKPAKFDHAKLFLLDGKHNASCVTCHTNNDYSKYTCYGCHAHEPNKIRSKHQEEGIRNFENCVACHRSANGEGEQGGSRKEHGRD
jgi:hypothetical protein